MRFNFAMEMHRHGATHFKEDLARFVWRSHTLPGRGPADRIVRFKAMGWIRQSPGPNADAVPEPKTWVRFKLERPDEEAQVRDE